MNVNSCTNELEWLAFCYAAGELSEPDAAQFETRLAADQSAREALARAVSLTQTIAAAESVGWALPTEAVSPAPRRAKTLPYQRVWIGLGVAAALLCILQISGLLDLTVSYPKKTSPFRARLASAWTETRAQMASDFADDLWPALDALHEAEDDLFTDGMPSDVPQAPSWLTAALLGQMTAAPAAESLNNGPIDN